ncbi:MAG: OmpH family outer membrane protein [Nitrospirae bacterium]|nr:MAG: OmpH family outer membrane protein [Nitrospirota bacterium]
MARRVAGTVTLALMAIFVHVVLLMTAAPSMAAEAFKMGVLDPQEVLEKSRSGKRALDALKEYARTRQKLLTSDEEELKGLEKQLKDQESGLAEAQKREKEAKFRAKIQEYQKRAQEFNQELQVKQKELVDDYMKKIAVAAKAVAERGGFSLVVDKGSETTLKIVIYNKDALDLTNEVIKEFDKQNK